VVSLFRGDKCENVMTGREVLMTLLASTFSTSLMIGSHCSMFEFVVRALRFAEDDGHHAMGLPCF
jgi:hypothetical protein